MPPSARSFAEQARLSGRPARRSTALPTSRRPLALCARLERGNEFPRAPQVCVLNKVPQEDVRVIRETFEHHVGPLGQAKAGP